MECYIDGCKQEAIIYCACSEIFYICTDHLIFHQSQVSTTNHRMYPIPKNELKLDNEVYLKDIKIAINDLQSQRKKLAKFSEDFNLSLIKVLKSLNFTIAQLKNFQKKYLTGINLGANDLKKLIREGIGNLKLSKLENHFLNFFQEIELRTSLLNKPQNLAYFINDTKSLIQYNVYTEKFILKNIDFMEPQGQRACVCYLGYDKIFLYGGYSNRYLATSYIISLSTNKVENLPSFNPVYATTPVLLNDKIYIFGGYRKENLQESSYFDLKFKTWIYITSLPLPQSDVSTLKIKKEIIITGSNKFLQIYYTEKNSYKDLGSGINPGSYNLLIKSKELIFLLAKKVYMAKKSEKKFMVLSLNYTSDVSYVTCQPLVRGDKAYFFDQNYIIYSFSFYDFSLKMIAKGSKA